MRNLKKLLAVFLSLAMLFATVPAVFAGGGEGDAPVLMSMPTADRIFAVVNDYSLDYGMLMAEYDWLPYTDPETGEHANIYDTVNKDGTLNEETKAGFAEMVDEGLADGSLDEDTAQLLKDAEDLTDILEVIAHLVYSSVISAYEELISAAEDEGDEEYLPILREGLAAFEENYPDHEAVYLKMMNDCFDGNAEPTVGEIMGFLLITGDMLIDEEGFLYIYDSDFAETPEDTWDIADLITPTGAFTDSYEMYGGHRNVYEQLKAEWDAGNIDNEEAFAILFGYVPDMDGYLRQAVPEYNTLYDENGLRIKNMLDLVNADGTVLDSGLSVRDFAIAEELKRYEDESISDIIGDELGNSYMGFLMNFILENMPLEDIMGDAMGGEVTEESVAAEIDGYIESMAPYEEYEGEIEEMLLIMFCGVEYDLYGYVAMGCTQDYLTDADGNKVKLSDVMAEDGTLLYPEMGDSVQALMEELLESISYDAVLLGDATGDGSINLTDASTMMKVIAGWDGVSADADAADANGDGSVNLSDVSLIMQYIADWDVRFAY